MEETVVCNPIMSLSGKKSLNLFVFVVDQINEISILYSKRYRQQPMLESRTLGSLNLYVSKYKQNYVLNYT